MGRLEGHGRRGKPLMADYVFVYRNTMMAVVEAKAWDQALTEGVGQAKNYADKLAIRFAYASNGQGVYGIDMLTAREGEIPAFPTPDELWNRTFAEQNDWRDRFAAVPFPDKSGSWEIRFYQEIAVNRVLERVAAGKDRILLTLATGTGKTSIAFQIAWKLFQARWSLGGEPTRRPRILFLADRNTLATQAYNDFTSFNAFADDAMVRVKPEDIRKKGKVPKNASLFFTIFQTFMSGPPNTKTDGKPSPYFGDYPPDFFDFIVIDECHRGGANDESTWRGILEYFAPAVQMGLTATPKRKDNIDTYKYFGEPVFVYSLKDGINDGFLTPFRVKQISTTLDEYIYTPDDSLIEGDIEVGKRYVEKDFNKVIEIKEREAHRVRLFMDQIQPNDKTVVFCASQAHALAAGDLVNQMKTSKDPGYCQRVTAHDGELGEQHLRDFQDNEKTIPTILTTSQKLSTGVDARNIRNIVLMRPINSMIEFKPIIGRGTRLYDGKDYFTIYDFVKAHHHFRDPEWDGEPVEPESTEPKAPKPDDPKKWEDHAHDGDSEPTAPKRQKIKVKLADGKARTIQHIMCTTFWHPDGTPMSAQQFMELLFGKLPDFLKKTKPSCAPYGAPPTRASACSKAWPKRALAKTGMASACLCDEHDVEGIIWAAPDSPGSGDLVLPLLKHLAFDGPGAQVATQPMLSAGVEAFGHESSTTTIRSYVAPGTVANSHQRSVASILGGGDDTTSRIRNDSSSIVPTPPGVK
jgi:type I restriction enzyme R subunit